MPGLGLGRGPVRTPMQWGDDIAAGFTTGAPWLPIADDFPMNNVSVLREDPRSILTLYHCLIELRWAQPALSVGDYAPLPAGDDLIAYMRKAGERRFLIVLNLGSQERRFNISELESQSSLIVSTHLDRGQETIGVPMKE